MSEENDNVIPLKVKRKRRGKVSDQITIEERNLKLNYDPKPVVIEPKWATRETKGEKQ